LFRILLILTFTLVGCGSPLANPIDYRYQKTFRVQSLSIEDGLSQSVVNQTIQDRYGYIWVATEDGLNRFDGYEFEIFEHFHDDPDSLHENLVYSLEENPGKGIWVGTQNGLSYFDMASRKFTNLSRNNLDLSVAIVALSRTDDGQLFIGSDNGLYILDSAHLNRERESEGSTKNSKAFDLKPATILPFVSEAGQHIDDEIVGLKNTRDHLWVATEKCVYSIALSDNQLQSLCESKNFYSLFENRRLKAIEVIRNKVWLASSNGLIMLDIAQNESQVFLHDEKTPASLADDWVQDLAVDAQGNLWVGSINGLSYLNVVELKFRHFQYSIYEREGLSNNDIMSVFVDTDGLIWAGTYTGGINILDPRNTGFKHILSKSDLSEFGINNTIHGIVKDNRENMWFANLGGGLLKMSLMTGEITRPLYSQRDKLAVDLDYTYSLLIDHNNQLWIGATDGLVLYDIASERIIPSEFYLSGEKVMFNDYVMQIFEDHQGDIWIGSAQGGYKVTAIKKEKGTAKIYLQSLLEQLPFSYRDRSNMVAAILETRDGSLWMGGQAGLLFFSKEDQTWRHFTYQEGNPQSLSNNDVLSLYEDSRGILWVGTADGLNRVIRSSTEDIYFSKVTRRQGLPNNAIYGILEDFNQQLWLSTTRGIVRYSENAGSTRSFRKNDGLSSDEFNKGAFYADSDGLLYFGSINGVTVIDSTTIASEDRENRLRITRATFNNTPLNIYDLNTNANSILKFDGNEMALKLEFTDLYYRKLGTQFYRYQLSGLNDKWIDLGKERQIVLVGIPEGKYLLKLQSRVADEDWPDSEVTIRLSVTTDFWKSQNSVYLIYLLTLSTFLFISYFIRRYYRLQSVKLRNRMKAETLRTREAKKESDDLSSELQIKSNQLALLHSAVDESSKRIASQSFRDPATGFYRFEHIRTYLTASDKTRKDSPQFNLVMVLSIDTLEEIKQTLGAICSIEVCEYIATELKNSASSQTHICAFDDGGFILFGNSVEYPQLTKTLLAMRDKVAKSVIPVGNAQAIQSSLSCSYLEIFPDRIDSPEILASLGSLLIKLHKEKNNSNSARLMRIDLKRALEALRHYDKTTEKMISDADISLQFL